MVIHIGKATFHISIELDSRYCQIPVHPYSYKQLSFFGYQYKLTYTGIPKGEVDLDTTFVAMIEDLQ